MAAIHKTAGLIKCAVGGWGENTRDRFRVADIHGATPRERKRKETQVIYNSPLRKSYAQHSRATKPKTKAHGVRDASQPIGTLANFDFLMAGCKRRVMPTRLGSRLGKPFPSLLECFGAGDANAEREHMPSRRNSTNY